MATIGTFTRINDDYAGAIKTLLIATKATIRAAGHDDGEGPDYRVYAGTIELGAAWRRTDPAGREYLFVKLDDPSLPAPICATLVEVEGAQLFDLVWSRQVRRPPQNRKLRDTAPDAELMRGAC